MTKIRAWRTERGYSLQEVADLTGVSVATLSRAERDLQKLTPDAKVHIARALSVPVSALFDPPGNES